MARKILEQVELERTTRIAATRLLRAAAAVGNQMLAGSRVLLLSAGSKSLLAAELRKQLAAIKPGVFSCLNFNAENPVCAGKVSALVVPGTVDSKQINIRQSTKTRGANTLFARYDFVFAAVKTPAEQLVTSPQTVLPPVYVVQPEKTPKPEDFYSSYNSAAAEFIEKLECLGLKQVAKVRANILEFEITANTQVADAASRVGERLAVLTEITANPAAGAAATRLLWATRGMPATAQLAKQLTQLPDFSRERILISLILEPKTASLALLLQQAGAQVAVFAAANETDPTVALELATRGVAVFAPQIAPSCGAQHANSVTVTSAADIDRKNALAALNWKPTLLIDDGAHLIRLAHTEQKETLKTLKAAAEETTSGVRPLQEMAALNDLKIPVIAVNNARTKTLFDNRVGTGESCVHAVLDVLDTPAQNTTDQETLDPQTLTWVIWGYGPVGEGVARAAKVYSQDVRIIEPDSVRALKALTDGYQLTSEKELPAHDFIAVSATGIWHTIKADTILQHPHTMTIAVAGGIDDEIALDELAATGWGFKVQNTAQTHLAVLTDPKGRTYSTKLLASGYGINYTAAEGNPLEVMDLSFATQLAALTEIITHPKTPGVYELSTAAENAVALAALQARNLPITTPPQSMRAGGAAQEWRIHRYKQS